MPRGGKRTGTPGKSYANRSDLQVPMMAATGQSYGARAEQMAAQRAVPVARPATDNVPTAGPAAPPTVAGPVPTSGMGAMPGELGPLGGPTGRPGEPVTAGVPVGAGPGPEALGGGDDVVMQLRAVYAAYPSEDLRAILERLEQ